MMERNERLKAADKCASKYTNENEARIARSSFMLGCEFEAQGEAIKGVILSTLEEPDKDLEEAANEYANKHYSEWDESWDDYNGHNVEPENDKLELIDAFIAGAKWVSLYGNDIKEL